MEQSVSSRTAVSCLVSAQTLPMAARDRGAAAPSALPAPRRSSAAVELGGSADALLDQPWSLTARGAELTVRPARPTDLPAMAALLVRCSPTTRLGWSGRGGNVIPLVQQDAWLRRPGSVVVELAPNRLVALGALRPASCTGVEDPIAGAVEVLVHDAWQRRGIGGTLVRHFAAALQVQGRSELQVAVDADREAAEAVLATLGGRIRAQRHAHGRCPRVHVPRTAMEGLGQLRELGR